jgi:octaprenyl-diphosphate synthase
MIEIFELEIEEVESALVTATADLTNPLGDLVRAQIKRSQPPIYGALVLAVSKPQAPAQETSSLHRKRILLAAALEMLHIALNVHRLLVNAAVQKQDIGGDNSLDRSFIGSTILAGDYCFSRAAQMAAQTDHPRVVAAFSLALQSVSEGLLREQFNTSANPYDESRQLLTSGAQAAARLIELSEKQQEQAALFSQDIAAQWAMQQSNDNGDRQTVRPSTPPLTPAPFPAYWQTLYEWLQGQTANGAPPSQRQFS